MSTGSTGSRGVRVGRGEGGALGMSGGPDVIIRVGVGRGVPVGGGPMVGEGVPGGRGVSVGTDTTVLMRSTMSVAGVGDGVRGAGFVGRRPPSVTTTTVSPR